MRTERDFLVDVLVRLNRSGVPYMLTGSMASNYYGTPRTTHDLDFVIHLAPAQADALVECFGDGFFIQKESVRTVFQPPYQFNILDEQSALKADFWQLRDDQFEQQMFERRQFVELFDTPAWIGSAEDILLHKLYWNRKTPSERQLLDAAGVYAVQSDTLDLDYVREWAEKLHVEREWNDLRSGRLKPKST